MLLYLHLHDSIAYIYNKMCEDNKSGRILALRSKYDFMWKI